MSKFELLFPVPYEYYNYTLPLYSFENVWVYLSNNEDEYTFLTKTNKRWSFCVAATTENILMNTIPEEHDNFKAVPISVKMLTETFRTIELDQQMMFVQGGKDFVCTNLLTFNGGPLYPSPDALCIVLIDVAKTTLQEPSVFHVTSQGKKCAVIHDNPHELLLITQIHGAWEDKNTALYMSYVPMQIIADRFDYVMYGTQIFSCAEFMALSSQSLMLMSDEYKTKIDNGEVDVF